MCHWIQQLSARTVSIFKSMQNQSDIAVICIVGKAPGEKLVAFRNVFDGPFYALTPKARGAADGRCERQGW
jgi:hypothetical protein